MNLKNRTKSIFLLLVYLLVLSPADMAAENGIKWMTFHWRPAMSLNGYGDVVGGVSGKQLLVLTGDMKEYTHSFQEMNWRRFWDVIRKKNENICNCMTIKTEQREKIAEFSEPISIALAVSVVMRKETAAKLGYPKSISLLKLMKDKRFTGNLVEGRSYSQTIDALLERHEKGSNITRQVMSGDNSVLMLLYNRIDYILEYPSLLDTQLSGRTPEEVDSLYSIQIEEIAPYYLVYAVCTKNDWGKKMIKRINTAIPRIHKTEAFRSSFREAYSGKALEQIDALFVEHFLKEDAGSEPVIFTTDSVK